MSDRLTQLQICLDQLVDQFSSSLHYVDAKHRSIAFSESEPLVTGDDYAPDSETEFRKSLEELTSDLIVKTRQILTIIDTLPGVNVSRSQQMGRIEQLLKQLDETMITKQEKIKRKNELQQLVDDLILDMSKAIADTR